MKEAKFKVGDKVLYDHTLHTGRVFVITDMRYVYYPTGDDWEYTLEHKTYDGLISIKVFGSDKLVAFENIPDALPQKPAKKNKKRKNKKNAI